MTCLLCASHGPSTYRHTKAGYEIRQCDRCGLVQLVPAPSSETLHALYQDPAYFAGGGASGYSEYGSQEREYVRTFSEDVGRLARFVPAGRVLDVGCGYGFFLKCALDAGYDAYGIDVSPAAVTHASRLHPGRVSLGSLEDAPGLGPATFHAIFASHVVEHLLDPAAFLRAAALRLEPGGVVMLVTPNVKSLLSRVSGVRWVSFKIPEHVAYYDPGTISELLRRSGFEPRAIDSAYQHYALPYVAARVRELLQPVSRLVPPLERLPGLHDACVRVTSGSMRVIAAREPQPRS